MDVFCFMVVVGYIEGMWWFLEVGKSLNDVCVVVSIRDLIILVMIIKCIWKFVVSLVYVILVVGF